MTEWLVDPESLVLPHIHEPIAVKTGPLSSSAELIAAGTSTEPLIEVPASLQVVRIYRQFGLRSMPVPVLLRERVTRRLVAAQEHLPEGFSLVILDAWRSREFQADLLAYYAERHSGDLDGFVSDPDNKKLVPPHVTGGAVDLTLAWQTQPLGLGTDYDDFTPLAAADALERAESATHLNRDLRRMFSRVMRAQNFSPLATEWWHWSYGDQYWAAEYREGAAIYGAADPSAR